MPVTPWGTGHPANRARDDRWPTFARHIVHGGPGVVHRLLGQLVADQQQQPQQQQRRWRAAVRDAAAGRWPAAAVPAAATTAAGTVGRRGRGLRDGCLLPGHHDTHAQDAPRAPSPRRRGISDRRDARAGCGRRAWRPPPAPGGLVAAFCGQARRRRRGRRPQGHTGGQGSVGKVPQARHRNGHHQIRQVGVHTLLIIII